jgi:hypothetical protein
MAAGISAGIAAAMAYIVARGTAQSARERLRAELRTEFMSEEAIRALLTHEKWTRRSFRIIRYHIRGFDDDELRKMLVSAGAVAFDGNKVVDGKPVEYWGLRTRNAHLLGYMPVTEDDLRSVEDVAGQQQDMNAPPPGEENPDSPGAGGK